jgi:DUF1680 family protein
MPVRFTVAHPAVDAVHGMAAIERGPVVYCLESPDQAAGVDLNRVELVVSEELVEEPRQMFGRQIVTIRVAAVARDDTWWQQRGWATLGEQPARQGQPIELVAIPYHLWANRGGSVMRVFTPIWPG